jgi:iron complex transport system substrate-binding protein
MQSRPYGMQKISMEQILRYDPDVIVFHEPLLAAELSGQGGWQNLRAVLDGRTYRIPRLPFNWFDRPPSFMRLLGLKWMMHHLYPDEYPIDLVSETRNFYGLFLNVTLDAEAAR